MKRRLPPPSAGKGGRDASLVVSVVADHVVVMDNHVVVADRVMRRMMRSGQGRGGDQDGQGASQDGESLHVGFLRVGGSKRRSRSADRAAL